MRKKTTTTTTTKRTKDGEEGTEGRRGAAPRDCGKCHRFAPWPVACSKSQIIFVILRVVCRITYWESQIFVICYGWAQISGTVLPAESSGSRGGSSGGSRGAEPRSRWPDKCRPSCRSHRHPSNRRKDVRRRRFFSLICVCDTQTQMRYGNAQLFVFVCSRCKSKKQNDYPVADCPLGLKNP